MSLLSELIFFDVPNNLQSLVCTIDWTSSFQRNWQLEIGANSIEVLLNKRKVGKGENSIQSVFREREVVHYVKGDTTKIFFNFQFL